MKIWFNNVIDTERQVVDVTTNRVRIGRSADNDIVLDNPYIAGEAAVLYKRGGVWELVALGINGVKLGDRQLYNGDRCEVRTNQSISLFPFTLTLDLPQEAELSQESAREELDQVMSHIIGEIHLELLERMNLTTDTAAQRDNEECLLELEQTIDKIARGNSRLRANQVDLINHTAGHGLRDHMLAPSETTVDEGLLMTRRHWSRIVSAVPDREQELESTADYMSGLLEIHSRSCGTERINAIEQGFWSSWDAVGDRLHAEFRQYLALRYFKKEIKNIVFGYGPLEDLLRLPTVSEIMVVDREHVYVERNGVFENSGKTIYLRRDHRNHHSADRCQSQSAYRQITAACGRSFVRRQPSQRGHCSAGRQRSDVDNSKISLPENADRRPRRSWRVDSDGGRIPASDRVGPQEYFDFRRNGNRKNDVVELSE